MKTKRRHLNERPASPPKSPRDDLFELLWSVEDAPSTNGLLHPWLHADVVARLALKLSGFHPDNGLALVLRELLKSYGETDSYWIAETNIATLLGYDDVSPTSHPTWLVAALRIGQLHASRSSGDGHAYAAAFNHAHEVLDGAGFKLALYLAARREDALGDLRFSQRHASAFDFAWQRGRYTMAYAVGRRA